MWYIIMVYHNNYKKIAHIPQQTNHFRYCRLHPPPPPKANNLSRGEVAINVDLHCCLRMVRRDPCPPPPVRRIYVQKMCHPLP